MFDYNLNVIARMEHEQGRRQTAEPGRIFNAPARSPQQPAQKRESIFVRVVEMMAQIVPQPDNQPARAKRRTT